MNNEKGPPYFSSNLAIFFFNSTVEWAAPVVEKKLDDEVWPVWTKGLAIEVVEQVIRSL